MGHRSRRRTPPSETEVKHLTAAEFYRSLIMRRNKRKRKEATLRFFFYQSRAGTCVLSIEE